MVRLGCGQLKKSDVETPVCCHMSKDKHVESMGTEDIRVAEVVI